MNKKEKLADNVHLLIHSLRLISGYKPSNAEKKLSEMVIETYKDECEECKAREEQLKQLPKEKSLMSRIGGILKDDND
jgi:hypothetical protein